MTPGVDATHVLIDGPWRHRFVAANGARFHVAEAGEGPLVVLLHGFPQHWWCWRDQLTGLADAGYRVAAMDLRGYGASDKPPRGYDTPTLAADVAAVVRSLGEPAATIVGHDWGAFIAWAMPVLFPERYDDEFDSVFGTGPHRGRPRAVPDPTVYVNAPDDPALRPDDEHEAWFVLVNAPRHVPDNPRAGIDWAATGFADEYADRILEANRSPVPGLFLVGGSSHPGGGLPLVGLSAAIVAQQIGRA